MGAVTYPHPDVVSFIDERFVPVKLHIAEQADAIEPYAVPWTPGLLVLDAGGRQHRRMVGYHLPEDLVAELALAWTVAAIEADDFAEAQARAKVAAERSKHDRERAAEARYWEAVVTYKLTGDGLIDGWRGLVDAFPGTTWARKVESIVKSA